MTDKRQMWSAVLMGLAGGAFIALGALSSIAFTEKAKTLTKHYLRDNL